MSRPAVVFDHVSKVYQLSHQKTENLKDRLTRMISGRAATTQAHQGKEDFYALRDVSFEIKPGESVGIIGPNGSGKSTSLKILAGVTKPTTGRFELHGRLGALIEVGAGFHPELSGRENIFLNGSILGMKKSEIQRKLDSIIDFAEIEQFIDTPVKHYSSGMYVRLGFSVAIHNEPEVMLVDEALAVGDLGFQKKCFQRMEELKEGGRTFILVSHSMSQIQSLCDRVIYLKKGGLVYDGAADEAANKYIDASEAQKRPSRIVEAGDQTDAITIKDVRLIGRDGASHGHVWADQPMKLEIEYLAEGGVVNPSVILVLKRGGMRIYSSNTNVLGIKLGTLHGHGVITCTVPGLPLLPNDFDVEVWMFDEAQENQLAKIVVKNLFSVSTPQDPTTLGCRLPVETAERGIIFAKADWGKQALSAQL